MVDIVVERDGSGVVRVTLNRPQRKNAMLPDMWGELTEALLEIDHHSADRVVILTGAGGEFCSGSDIAARRAGAVEVMGSQDLMSAVTATVLALHNLSKPTIAAVGGVAAGGGCNLALACDILVASDTARFCEIFVRRGLVVDTGGSWLLPRLVGLAEAKRLVLLGNMIDAEESARIGLVSKVVPAEGLLAEADALARRLIRYDSQTLAANKKLLHDALAMTLDDALEAEACAQLKALENPSTAAALQAFLDRRN